MTYTDEDVERVALKICEALGDWNPVPMNKMAYEDAARAVSLLPADLERVKTNEIMDRVFGEIAAEANEQ